MGFSDYWKEWTQPYVTPNSQMDAAQAKLMNLMLQQQQQQAYPLQYVNVDPGYISAIDYGVNVTGTDYTTISDSNRALSYGRCTCNLCRSYENQYKDVAKPPERYNPIPIERREIVKESGGIRQTRDIVTGQIWNELLPVEQSCQITSTPRGTNFFYNEWQKVDEYISEEKAYSKKVRKLFWARKDKLLDKNKTNET